MISYGGGGGGDGGIYNSIIIPSKGRGTQLMYSITEVHFTTLVSNLVKLLNLWLISTKQNGNLILDS